MTKPDPVAEEMEKHGRWSALNRDPELNARFNELLRERGWKPEEGYSALETAAAYLRQANADAMNGAREPFGKRYTDEEVVSLVAERGKLGTPAQVQRMVRAVEEADLHDDLLARLAERDQGQSSAPIVSSHEEYRTEAQDLDERRSLLASAFTANEEPEP